MKAQPRKPLIAIGICTRQRNALLRRLLKSIVAQPKPLNYDVKIIIVDNNDTPTVTDEIIGLSLEFPVELIHEPKAGLVYARNRVLTAATQADADWLIGVDDDEWVAPDWLEQFIIGIETLDAPIIVAAKNVEYPSDTTPYLEQLQSPQTPAGEITVVHSTANFAMRNTVFNPDYGPGLRFALEMNQIGGEDYELMLRAKYAYDMKAVKWPYAVATEVYEGKRTTLRYHFKRRLMDQVSRYYVSALHCKAGLRGTRARNAMRMLLLTNRFVIYGTGRILLGSLLCILINSNGRMVIGNGILTWARALAVFHYLLGMDTPLYGAGVDADRTRTS